MERRNDKEKMKNKQVPMIYLFVAAIVIAFTSCGQKKTIANYLTGGSQKYWIMILEHPIKTGQGALFCSDGSYEVFFENENGSRIRTELNSARKWKFIEEDSTLVMGQDIKLRIEYINEEVVVMNNVNMRQIVVYKAAGDQKSPLQADTVDHSTEL